MVKTMVSVDTQMSSASWFIGIALMGRDEIIHRMYKSLLNIINRY